MAEGRRPQTDESSARILSAGLDHLSKGEWEQAVGALVSLIHEGSGEGEEQLARAIAAELLREEVAPHLQAALVRSVPAAIKVAMAAAEANDAETAIALWEAVQEQVGPTAAERGDIAAGQAALRGNAAGLRRALQVDPELGSAYRDLGDALARLGQEDEALGAYEQAIRLDPRDAEALGRRARVRWWKALAASDEGKTEVRKSLLDQAIADYDAVLALIPGSLLGHLERAGAHATRGDRDLALTDYAAAISIDPWNVQAHAGRAQLLWEMGSTLLQDGAVEEGRRYLREAIADMDAVIATDPDVPDFHEARGLMRQAMGEPKAALKDFDEAVRLAPAAVAAWRNRAEAHADLGEVEEAIEDYTKAIEIDATDASTFVSRGSLQGALERLEEAVADYSKALQLDPANVAALDQRGSIYLFLGRRDQGAGEQKAQDALQRAAADFEAVTRHAPDMATAYADLGESLWRLGKNEDALSSYTKAIELSRTDPSLLAMRALVFLALNRTQEAVADCVSSIRIDPKDATSHARLANLYVNMGDAASAAGQVDEARDHYLAAVKSYDTALTIDPKLTQAFFERGIAYARLGDWRRATDDYTAALHLDSGNVEVLEARAAVLETQGRTDEAFADYDKVVEARGDAEAYATRGNAHFRMNELESALKDFSWAIELDPDNVQARTGRGLVHEFLGDYGAALADYEESVRLSPDDALAYRNRADALTALGYTDRALADYVKATELDPSYLDAYLGRGETHAALGQHERALQAYEAAVALDPSSVKAILGRAETLSNLGDQRKAQSDYARAVELAPNDLRAHQGLTWTHIALGDEYRSGNEMDRARDAYENAVQVSEQAVQIDRSDVLSIGYQSIAFRLLDAFDLAVEDIDRALLLEGAEPANMQSWLYGQRAEAMRMWGEAQTIEDPAKLAEAVANYEVALGRSGPDEDVVWMLEGQASSLLILGRYDEALAVYRDTVVRGASPWSRYNMGKIHLYRADLAEAVDAFKQAVGSDGDADVRIWGSVGLGLALGRSGRTEDGSRVILGALPDPPTAFAYYRRAAAFEDLGEHERADDDMEQAIRLEPDNPDVLNSVAWTWSVRSSASSQHLKEAVRLAKRAAEIEEGVNRGHCLDTQGWAEFRLGRAEDAREHLNAAEELVPRDVTIRTRCQRVEQGSSA